MALSQQGEIPLVGPSINHMGRFLRFLAPFLVCTFTKIAYVENDKLSGHLAHPSPQLSTWFMDVPCAREALDVDVMFT